MDADVLLAITNWELQLDDFIWLGILTAVMAIMARYVRKLTQDLRRARQLLEDQAKFNSKLNATVERMLRIDQEGKIDSHRRPTKR